LESSIQENDLSTLESLDTSITLNSELLEKMPQYQDLIPLAEQKDQIDEMLLATKLFQLQNTQTEGSIHKITEGLFKGISYRRNWWGFSVDVPHEQFINIVHTSSYASVVGGSLSAVLSGPLSLGFGIISTVIKIYGTALESLERGNGFRFHIPWLAIYPIPNPIYVVPIPL